VKKELELEDKLKLLEREVSLLGDEAEKSKLDLKEAVDSLKLEIESLKIILKEMTPDFEEKFKNARNYALREIDPEWPSKK
jgi:hypothetical protein